MLCRDIIMKTKIVLRSLHMFLLIGMVPISKTMFFFCVFLLKAYCGSIITSNLQFWKLIIFKKNNSLRSGSQILTKSDSNSGPYYLKPLLQTKAILFPHGRRQTPSMALRLKETSALFGLSIIGNFLSVFQIFLWGKIDYSLNGEHFQTFWQRLRK